MSQIFHLNSMYRVAQIKIPHRTKCNFSTTVWDFYTKIYWFIWERSCYNSDFKENYFSFLQSYGCINILCHIFNCAWNNQQQLVIFIVKKLWLITNTKIYVVRFSVCLKCPTPAFTQARSSIWLCWSSLVAAGPISTSWAHLCSSDWVEMTCSVQA